MKNIFNFCLFLLVSLVGSCTFKEKGSTNSLDQNNNEPFIIHGRVLVEDTNEPPLGVNSINITNKWIWENKALKANGANEKAFIDKDGYYQITIQKGDTLKLIPSHFLYKKEAPNYSISGLTNSQMINFTIKIDSIRYTHTLSQLENDYIYKNHLENVDPEKLVRVKGILSNKNTKNKRANTYILSGDFNNSEGSSLLALTTNEGEFDIEIPKHSRIIINPFGNLNEDKFFIHPTKDTIVNLEF